MYMMNEQQEREARNPEVEILDEHTGELVSIEASPETESAIYTGMALEPFPAEAQQVLRRNVDPERVQIRPDGIVFLPGVEYRRALNEAFGAGAWALRPLNTGRQEGRDVVYYHGALYVLGRFVAESVGEHEYRAENANTSYATSIESAKTDCLTRCCKDLGIASELWDGRWVEEWKERYAMAVWCEFIGKGHNHGSKKKNWRRTTDKPFEYPWRELVRNEGEAVVHDGPTGNDLIDLFDTGNGHSNGIGFRNGNGSTNGNGHANGAGKPGLFDPIGDWRAYRMTFGKHKGKKLAELPEAYVDWLASEWEPKGYEGDAYIAAMLDAREAGEPLDNVRRITSDEAEVLKAAARDHDWDARVAKQMLQSLFGVSRFEKLPVEKFEACRMELTNPVDIRWTPQD